MPGHPPDRPGPGPDPRDPIDPRLLRRLGRGRAMAGRITRIVPLGDPHRGGHRVSRVELGLGDDRLTVIHKPRPVEAERLWGRAVRWLAARAGIGPLLLPRIVARRDHGWVEHLEPRRPRSEEEARRFFERAGALLALWDVLEVRDVHRGNLLAVGDQPVLVDAETIGHPRLIPFRSAPSLALTGFFPAPGATDDRAGLFAGIPGPAGGHPPLRYLEPLVAGYQAGHRALTRHGAGLLRRGGPLGGLGGLRARVVLRPTAVYRGHDAARPWPPAGSRLPIPRRGQIRVLQSERASLEAADVPVFATAVGGTDLEDERGVVVRRCFARSALDRIDDRLRTLSPADERAGVELINGLVTVSSWIAVPGRAGSGR